MLTWKADLHACRPPCMQTSMHADLHACRPPCMQTSIAVNTHPRLRHRWKHLLKYARKHKQDKKALMATLLQIEGLRFVDADDLADALMNDDNMMEPISKGTPAQVHVRLSHVPHMFPHTMLPMAYACTVGDSVGV